MLLDNVFLTVNDVNTLLAHIGDTLDGRGVAIERIDGAA
jgi:hypothetical protein